MNHHSFHCTPPTHPNRTRFPQSSIVIHLPSSSLPSKESLLVKGVHKRLGVAVHLCSSADATSIIGSTATSVGSSSGQAIDRHSPRLRHSHHSSTSKLPRPSTSSTTKDTVSSDDSKPQQQHVHGSKKKKSTTAGAVGLLLLMAGGLWTSSRFLVSPQLLPLAVRRPQRPRASPAAPIVLHRRSPAKVCRPPSSTCSPAGYLHQGGTRC